MSQNRKPALRHDSDKGNEAEVKKLRRALAKAEAELDRERREKARLKRQISSLKGAYGQTPHEQDVRLFRGRRGSTEKNREQEEMLRAGQVNARRFSKRSYASYLIQTIKESMIGLFFGRLARYLRRLRLFRTVAAVVTTLVVTLLLSAVFLTVLPLLALLGLGTFLAVFLRARAANRRLLAALSPCERIRVIILPEQITFTEDTFAERSAKAMATEETTAVLVVTPRLWSSKGLGGKGMFFTARREAPRLFLVRRGYYFIMRRGVLDHCEKDITVIY